MQPLLPTSEGKQREWVFVLESQIGSASAPILKATSGQRVTAFVETISKLKLAVFPLVTFLDE